VNPASRIQLREVEELAVPSQPPGASLGDQLGRYELLGEIGQGGMGTVLRVRDPELGRDLAVKLLRQDRQEDPQTLQRFIEEAQIGGQLQHPGIVPVYELGRLRGGRPYFTMKLVRGRTLADLLAERTSPQHDLSRFLGIFEQVCQTVAYAHARGVIHRDLKPSNVMVGAFGEVQVMDWGLAKVLPARRERQRPEEARLQPEPPSTICTVRTAAADAASQAGTVVGTYAYMAPEQALGAVEQLDERSDVFGLGAMLCEILTGRPPYVADAGWKLHQQAMLAELQGAFARLDASGADAELLALAKRCLAREPAERPADAGAVAQAVAAHRSALAERLRRAELERAAAQARAREERRRRRVTAALAVALVLLLGAAAGGAWLLQRRSAHRQQVDSAVLSASRRAQDAGGPAWEAHDLDRLGEARAEAEKAVEMARSGEAGEEALAEARAVLGQLEAWQAQARRNRELLTALREVRGPDEMETYQRANSGTTLAPAEPLADDQFAAAFRRWGLDLDAVPPEAARARIQEQPARVVQEVIAALDEWAEVRRGQKGPGAAGRRLVDLADRLDGNKRTRQLRRIVADGRLQQERLVGALTHALLPWSAATHPAVGGQQNRLRQLAEEAEPATEPVLGVLALVRALRAGGDKGTAEQLLRRCLLARPGEEALLWTLARLLQHQRPPRLAEAIECHQRARTLRPELGLVLSQALQAVGKVKEAVALMHDLIRRQPERPELYFFLGVALHEGRPGEAVAAYRRAIALKPEDAAAHYNLGNVQYQQGRFDEAVTAYQQAIALKPDLALAHMNLGSALAMLGRPGEAVAASQRATALMPEDALAHYNLGYALVVHRRFDEAVAAWQKAIALKPDFTEAHHNLGNALCELGHFEEAVAAFQRAIASKPDFALAHCDLGDALFSLGRLDEAVASCRRAIALNPDLALAHCNLGHALLRKGEFAAALAEHRRGHELGMRQPDWRAPSARWVQEAKQLIQLDAKLPLILQGGAQPRDDAECVALAQCCGYKRRYLAAVGFWQQAFTRQPVWAEDLKAGHRYNAACAAALAAAGQGQDATRLDVQEVSRLRQSAWEWLRADLALWTKERDKNAAEARAAMRQALERWQHEPDLDGVRDEAALAKLPEAERRAWRQLWADVAELLQQAERK
jgi:serine/threonine-protein kinase